MSKKVLALIAVRMKSTRLTAKAMKDLSGAPLILKLHHRLLKSKRLNGIVWCTSTNEQDNQLQELAEHNNISFYRGSELDVIDRFLAASDEYNPDIVVRVTGDNPLTDPEMMDYMIQKHIDSKVDYTFTDDLPIGTRPEIISISALKRCHDLAQDPDSSEYLTLMLRRPSHFNIQEVRVLNSNLKRPKLRLTVDTAEDLEVMRCVYKEFFGDPPELLKIINWLDQNPEIRDINKNIIVKDLDSSVNVLLKGD
jgi:spore coat polysaccharide biosynthesis protein SpsF